MIVLDASVAVKWFRQEIGSEVAAQAYLTHRGDLVAPDIFATEVAGALVRNANEIKALRADTEYALSSLQVMLERRDIRLLRVDGAMLGNAARLAMDLGHPLKDCVYLACAIEHSCELLTGDAKFAASATSVWSQIRILQAAS